MSLPNVMLGRRSVAWAPFLEGSQQAETLTFTEAQLTTYQGVDAKGGNDTITVSGSSTQTVSNITVDAGGGDDTVIVGVNTQDNTYTGGAGTDTLSFAMLGSGVTIDLSTASGSGQTGTVRAGLRNSDRTLSGFPA